jgi:transcriptional regulator
VYIPPHFQQPDSNEVRRFMRSARLGTLVTNGPSGLFASHLPMMLVDDPPPHGRLLCHVSHANEQWKHTGEAMIVFLGPNAYLTPSNYATTEETGKVVPTWNYIAAQAHGTLRAIEDPRELLALVTTLTDLHEARRENPWHVNDAPVDFIQSQLRGIVGIEMRIERIDAKWKLSQNRNAADERGATEGLRNSEDPLDRATGDAMWAARPRE